MGSKLDSSFKVFLRFDEIEQKKIDSKMSINSEIDPIFPSWSQSAEPYPNVRTLPPPALRFSWHMWPWQWEDPLSWGQVTCTSEHSRSFHILWVNRTCCSYFPPVLLKSGISLQSGHEPTATSTHVASRAVPRALWCQHWWGMTEVWLCLSLSVLSSAKGLKAFICKWAVLNNNSILSSCLDSPPSLWLLSQRN